MNKVILFKHKSTVDSEQYNQLVRVSGVKDQEQFFHDLEEIDIWWKNECKEAEGDIGEDEYIDKLKEYGWTIEYIFEELEVSF